MQFARLGSFEAEFMPQSYSCSAFWEKIPENAEKCKVKVFIQE